MLIIHKERLGSHDQAGCASSSFYYGFQIPSGEAALAADLITTSVIKPAVTAGPGPKAGFSPCYQFSCMECVICLGIRQDLSISIVFMTLETPNYVLHQNGNATRKSLFQKTFVAILEHPRASPLLVQPRLRQQVTWSRLPNPFKNMGAGH